MKILTKHLTDVNETYFQHLGHAMYFAFNLLVAAIVCTIHAIFPFIFERSGSRRVADLYSKMIVNRATD